MKYKYIFIIILLLSISLTSSIALAYSEPIDVLDTFYQASIDKDVNEYVSVQDPLFLKQMGDYESYFKNTFDEVNILNYKIIDPEIFEKENRTLIFYELKGTFEIDGIKTDIDNDMVAFLWKYDDWKVRWTITRELFEKKIQYGMIMDASIEMLFDEVSNQTVKEEMVEKGYDVTIDDKTFDKNSNDDSGSFWTWIILILLLGVFLYFYKKKPIVKKRTDIILKKIFVWFKNIFVPFMIKLAKLFWKGAVKTFNLIVYHSNKAYKKSKPHIKNTYNKGIKKINEFKKKKHLK